jgi:GPH family glycoside/pentoside/hexuronide:cation symporter
VNPAPLPTPRVSLFTRTAFGAGQLAEGVKAASFNYFLLFYYTQVLGLPGTWTGLALFVATTFDALTDPLAGSLSDRLRHRWGRRHPFMYASALPMGLSFALLFAPPAGLGREGLFLWLLAFTVLVRGSMTLYHVPHLALGAELSEDYAERTTIVAFRTFFGLAGTALAIACAWLYFFRSTPEFPTGQLNPAAYPGYGLLFSAVVVLSILGSAWGTHDRIPFLPRPPDDEPPFSVRALVDDYVGALRNDSFRAIFVGVVIFFVMRGIQEVLGTHMATYFWKLEQKQIFATSAAGVVGFLVGIPFAALAAARLDKRPAFLGGVAGFSVLVLAPPLAKLVGWFPPQESPLYLGLLVGASFAATFSAAAGVVMAGSMMADIADEHELVTGVRREGIFFGALAFAGKSTSGLGSFLGGAALDAIRFPTQAEPGTVPAHTVDALGIVYGPGIAILAVVALVFLGRYRIDRARHAQIAAALAQRRAQSA